MTIDEKTEIAKKAAEEWWPIIKGRVRCGNPHPLRGATRGYIAKDILAQGMATDEAVARHAAGLACVMLNERAKKFKEELDGLSAASNN